jgi:hypothetical protein
MYNVSERIYVRIGYIITYYLPNWHVLDKFINIVFIMSGRFLLPSTIQRSHRLSDGNDIGRWVDNIMFELWKWNIYSKYRSNIVYVMSCG